MKNRISHLRALLKEKNLDGMFLSAIPSIVYVTNFTGFDNEDRNAFLLITRKDCYIFTHGIYKQAVQKYISDFILIDIERNQPVSTSLKSLIEKHDIKRLGFEGSDLRFIEYASLVKKIGKNILTLADSITEQLRIKKSPSEIAAIKKTCQIGDEAFTFLLGEIKSGVSEKELALSYELFIRKKGAKISFDTIVAFGSNGSLPHHIPTDKKLTKNSFIVLDFGVKVDDYCSDMTRTVFFGKANGKQKKMYQTVRIAQQKSIDYLNTNRHSGKRSASRISKQNRSWTSQDDVSINASQVDKIARDYIVSAGYPNMPHSLGHGIGLLVHELPRLSLFSKDLLTEGMVFSVEPGIYVPEIGGVRIEDLITIKKTGVEILTTAPKHLIELS